MSNSQDTIGLSQLLDEVSNDIDELHKKHPSDYGVKNLTMWWELERERLVTRHGSTAAVTTLLRVRSLKRLVIAFLAGCAAVVAATAMSRMLLSSVPTRTRMGSIATRSPLIRTRSERP